MNVNKKILILISLLFLCITNVNAAVCRDNLTYNYCVTRAAGYTESSVDSYSVPFKYINGSETFCSQYSKISPLGCNSYTTFSDPVEAGVSYIVNSNLKYICKERAITKFLYNKYNTEGRENFNLDAWPWNNSSQCGTNSNTVYNEAISRYNLVNAIVSNEITFNSVLNFTKSGDNFVASTTVNIPTGMGDNWNCWASGSGSTVSYSGTNYTTVTVTTPVSNAGQTITLTCAGYKQEYNLIWYYYNCQGYNNRGAIVDGQTLVQNSNEIKYAYNDNSISGKTPSTTELIVNKVNSVGDYIMNAPVIFNIYTDSECSESSYYKTIDCNTGSGVNTETNTCKIEVPINSYYIKETSISKTDSNGIIYVPSGECKGVGPIVAGSTKNITYVNKTQCELDFEADSSIKNRLFLYQTRYPNFRNLLNFNPEITSSIACSPYYPNYESEEKCLYSNKVSDDTTRRFSEVNLSDYNDEIVGENDSKSYCLTNFKLESSIDITSPVSSGRIVYGVQRGDQTPIVAKLTKTCYIYEEDFEDYNIESLEVNLEVEELKNKLTKYTSVLTGKSYYSDTISSSKIIDPDNYIIKNNQVFEKPSTTDKYIYVEIKDEDGNYYDKDLTIYNFLHYYKKNKKEKIYCNNLIEYQKVNSSETYKFCFQDSLITSCLRELDLNPILNNSNRCKKYEYEYDSSNTYYFIEQGKTLQPLFENDVLYDGKNYYLIERNDMSEFVSIGNNEYVSSNSSYKLYSGSQSFYNKYMNYDDYITNVSLDGSKLNNNVIFQEPIIEKVDNFYKVTGIIEAYYTLNPISIYKLSGKLCEQNSNQCSTIGYGVVSKFIDGANNAKSSFNFSISNVNAKNFNVFNFNDNNICEYQSIPEIITYDQVPNGKIELEFRSIDTSNPFPGVSGSTRITGSNWCDETGNCSGDSTKNQIINDVITNSNNSYNKDKTKPIYTIKLTPKTISDIRNYNKSNPYDDYWVTCDQITGKCENSFLNQYSTIITKN